MSNMIWIDPEFMPPQLNYPVLVTDAPTGEKPCVYVAVYDGLQWFNIETSNAYDEHPPLYNVTHWMPYPDPAQPAAPPAEVNHE